MSSEENNWEEDFKFENGTYLNRCTRCKRDFLGHKRRIICKTCFTNPKKTVPEDLSRVALLLYDAPFTFKHGYIYDANNSVVADDAGQSALLRIRGWGRISYMPNPEELQDTVGHLIALALTEYWTKYKGSNHEIEKRSTECNAVPDGGGDGVGSGSV